MSEQVYLKARISKWSEFKDRTGTVAMSGGYYGDMDNPEAGKPYTRTKVVQRKKLLGVIPRKPKVQSKTYMQPKSYPVLRYRRTGDARDKFVLPSDVNPKTFDRKRIRVQTEHPNAARFAEWDKPKKA